MLYMSVGDPLEISSRAFVGYPVQADLILICHSCILLYVGNLAKENQPINLGISNLVYDLFISYL